MLPRILEPEVMESPEEALAYDAMDHSEVNRRFVDDFLAAYDEAHPSEPIEPDNEGDDFASESPHGPGIVETLDLGTGTAQIPIELARRQRGFRVMAVDLSPSMLQLARGNIEVAGLTNWIRVDLVDAKRLPYEPGRFGAVISNSIVHHLADPRDALADACRVVAPGGLIFVRDLSRPADLEELNRLVELYAGEADDRQRGMFADSLHAALDLASIREIVAELGFDRETVRATSDRHWTWSAIQR